MLRKNFFLHNMQINIVQNPKTAEKLTKYTEIHKQNFKITANDTVTNQQGYQANVKKLVAFSVRVLRLDEVLLCT